MAHHGDLEKETGQKGLGNLPPIRTYSTESTLEERALDAETNVEEPGRQPGTVEEKSPPQAGPVPPNGGLRAWLIVAGSFFLFFNSWGTVNSFGVFQTYYESNLLANKSPSDISWIGSVQACLLMMVGVLTGPIYDAGHFRALVFTGTFMVTFGFMMTSICKEYYQVMLAQAVCIGIGNGCLFIPSVAILPQYFSTRKALANGIAAAGSSFGGIIYPIMFRQLYPRIGFGWATRIMGFICLGTCAFSLCVMKIMVMPKQKRHLTDISAFKELPYTLFCIAMFFGFMGFYGPLYFIGPYAIQRRITDVNLAFYLLPILNAASIPGRIVPNFFTDYTGPMNILAPASIITAILALGWIGVTSLAGILAYAVLYGFFSGGFISLPPVGVVSLTTDMRKIGTRMGQLFFISALGLLVGSPVGGAILTRTGSYLGLQLYSGIMLMACGLLLATVRVLKTGWKLKAKA